VRMATKHAGPPARVELSGRTLIAHGDDESVLWSYRVADKPGGEVDGAGVREIVLQGFVPVDWQATGDYETLVFLSIRRPAGSPRGYSFDRAEVYCLSSNGRMRWKYSPDARMTFAGREFAGPWMLRTWLLLAGPRPRLWASFIDQIWWPSFVVSFGPEGVSEPLFVNAGHIESLGRIKLAGGTYVLAGGVNNEFRSAALAVLDEHGVPNASPQTAGSSFVCDGCPGGRPRKYLLFPRSELSVALGEPYNFADFITFLGSDVAGVEVSVREHPPLDLRTVYRLSAGLTPQSVAMSDRYWEKHREMFRNGTLDHAAEDCPERTHGMTVRMWMPDGGWTALKVPPTFPSYDSRPLPIQQ
jgi:hypothetical protein